MTQDEYRILTTTANIAPTLKDPSVGSLVVHNNKILGDQAVDGLEVIKTETSDGVDISLRLKEGVVIDKPVHMCFGVLHGMELQKINLNVHLEKGSSMKVYGHCILTADKPVKHVMDAEITLENDSRFSYFERHTHNDKGTTEVYPKSVVKVGKNARYRTEFELLKGRVGRMEIDIESYGAEKSVSDMITRVSAHGADKLSVREVAHLNGEYARSALRSKVAVRDEANADIYNKIIATHAHAKGHVDCTEVLKDEGVVSAYPDVEVRHPKARVTHEAKLGGVDDKQLETLMSKGLSESQAEEIIIEG
ncbi:MAG: SufB/SufD family protein, partial [Candidatus Woesearchaeota archaeon]